MVGVEQWAELRREHFVRGVSIKELARRTGLSRNTIRAALRSSEPPVYRRASGGSKLDPFKDEIHRLLHDEPDLPGQRIRELIAQLGFAGGKTIVDDYLREVRPLFATPRTYQRTVYRPGEICQFDLWEPRAEIPVGHGQTPPRLGRRRVLGLLARRRRRAGLLQADPGPAVRASRAACGRSGRCRETLVWDRQAGLHAHGGRPTDAFAAFCGAADGRLALLRAGDPQAKGVVERLQGFMRDQLRARPRVRQRARLPAAARRLVRQAGQPADPQDAACRPIDRLAAEHEVMAPLPAIAPDSDRRWVLRVPPDPYLRFDTNDYSFDPALVGRRVEVARLPARGHGGRAGHRRAGLPPRRCFARHRTITDLEHARTLEGSSARPPRRRDAEVEVRPLARYDALIA